MSRASARIYRKAAMLVDGGKAYWSCCAITYYDGRKYQEERDNYDELFRPRRATLWWGEGWSDDLADRRNCRVLALLFAAAMAESGDLP